MKTCTVINALLCFMTSFIHYGQESIYKVQIAPQENEAFVKAEYTLWIPEGIKQVQRIILHQHGCGDNAQKAGETVTDDLHWRLLAEKTGSALLGSSLWPKGECADWCDPDNGTERAFKAALNELAELSQHPSIATVNWVVWGHSGGGYWAQSMLQKYPERFDAIVLQSAGLRVGELRGTPMKSVPYPTDVPMMIHTGIEEKGHERFDGTYKDALILFDAMRKNDAPVTLVIDPASGHGSGDSRYLTIPWIAASLDSNKEAETIWPNAHSEHGIWFPDQAIAAKWDVFTKLGNVPDYSIPESSPFNLKARKTDKGIELLWNATPDWESGIKTFRIYRNGTLLKPYTAPARKEGELTEYYRKPNYSDTPSMPVSKMEYLDTNMKSDTTYMYQVSFVNWAGLESPKSQLVEIKWP